MKQRLTSLIEKLDFNTGLQYWLLAAITLLALALRFYKLGQWSFWIDEIFTINHAQAHFSSLALIFQHIPPHRNWIPLSVIATASVLNLAGTSEWSARLVPALIGIISIPLLYFPVKQLFGVRVGLIMALLLAVSPWHLFWSQNARFYTALLLLYTLALFVLFYSLEQNRPLYLLLFVVLFYLAMSERLIALFLVPVIGCYLLLLKLLPVEKPHGFQMRNILILIAPGLVFGLYEVYLFVVRGSSILTGTLDTFAEQANHSPLRLALAILYRLGIPLVCVGSVGGLNAFWSKNRQEWFVTLGAVVPILAIVAISPFFFTVDRYVFVTLPFWAILAGLALERLPSIVSTRTALPAVALLSILVLSAMSENMLYFQYQNGNRPDWRTAFAIVAQAKQADDRVLTTQPEMGEYYLQEKVDNVNSFTVTDIERSQQSFWFVIDESTGYVDPALHAWIKQHSTLVEVLDIHLPAKSISIRIYRYEPAQKVAQLQSLVLPALASMSEG